MLSLNLHSQVLQLSHIRPLIFPVLWSWSRTTLLVIQAMVVFWHTGHSNGSIFGLFLYQAFFSFGFIFSQSMIFLQSLQDGLLTVLLFFQF